MNVSQLSMLDLFRVEAESQTQLLTAGLLALERNPTAADQLEICMRAAHSLKGAARIVGVNAGIGVAHAMEDCFVAAQKARITLQRRHIDVLFSGVDLLARIGATPDKPAGHWAEAINSEVDAFLSALATAIETEDAIEPAATIEPPALSDPIELPRADETSTQDRMVRVTADNLNRLLGLAGESLVESRWLKPFADSLLRLKRLQRASGKRLENFRETLLTSPANDIDALDDLQHLLLECEQILSQRLTDLETFSRRSTNLSHRLYDEAVACRMRPFADGVQAFPRMARDVGRSLEKQVKLVILGEATPVDRDVLEKLDAPLGHLIRNAIDHGLELPDVRKALGKSPEGVVRVEARHSAGALQIIVSDDGRGVDLETLRKTIVERSLTNAEIAAKLSEAELLEFLFLPGFSMKDSVTDISGRGVGLDVVQTMVKQLRGSVRVFSKAGEGTRFQMQFPLTLSVVRTLLVDIGGEPYAFPLAYIVRTLKLSNEQIELLEGRQHFQFGKRQVGIVAAHQILKTSAAKSGGAELSVIVIGDGDDMFGLVVDRFLGERELVVQPLDPRLGKIKDIAAGALMEDGAPVLIVDVDDMIRSTEKLIAAGELGGIEHGNNRNDEEKCRRVLVVDDSLTVRELERKLLSAEGYEVEVAVDGMDGWNAVRLGHFDLVITDIDMPRMDGIELVTRIKKDPHLRTLPVMVVSYKDREEDRRRGLEAGADYYLAKGSFHDETLLQAVVDLIGEAR